MPPDEQDKLDALIESALFDEPELGVPFGFHRAVDERLHMAALLDLERGRFRRCWISAGAFVSLVALASAVGWIAADVGGTISRTVPGALLVNQIFPPNPPQLPAKQQLSDRPAFQPRQCLQHSIRRESPRW